MTRRERLIQGLLVALSRQPMSSREVWASPDLPQGYSLVTVQAAIRELRHEGRVVETQGRDAIGGLRYVARGRVTP